MKDFFSINFLTDTKSSAGIFGEINLCGDIEGFNSTLGAFNLQQYEHQWHTAIKQALDLRTLTCMVTDVCIDGDCSGSIEVFTLIPSEAARGSESYESSACGFYITQLIKKVTTNPCNLQKRIFIELVDGTVIGEQAVYYFNPSEPDRIFPYLNDSISNISSWFVSNEAIRAYLDKIDGRV